MSGGQSHPREQLERALEQLTEPGRLDEAQRSVGELAPSLQMILARALQEGGWFDSAHDQAVREALADADAIARERSVRTLVAEETRVAMLVGVAVGMELARTLEGDGPEMEGDDD